jgi:hypothetical protein
MGWFVNGLKLYFSLEVAKLVVFLFFAVCLAAFLLGLKMRTASAGKSGVSADAEKSTAVVLLLASGIPLGLLVFVEVLPLLIFGGLFDMFK